MTFLAIAVYPWISIYRKQVQQNTKELASPPFPLIVISHGIASDRSSFVYLAEHLASYGFAVAVLEHPGSNAERIQLYFAGLAGPPDAAEFINDLWISNISSMNSSV